MTTFPAGHRVGEVIAFTSLRDDDFASGPTEPLSYDDIAQPYAELFVMDADGTNQRPLTDNQWEDGTSAWLPAFAPLANSRQ